MRVGNYGRAQGTQESGPCFPHADVMPPEFMPQPFDFAEQPDRTATGVRRIIVRWSRPRSMTVTRIFQRHKREVIVAVRRERTGGVQSGVDLQKVHGPRPIIDQKLYTADTGIFQVHEQRFAMFSELWGRRYGEAVRRRPGLGQTLCHDNRSSMCRTVTPMVYKARCKIR